jgi:hypothetical protein
VETPPLHFDHWMGSRPEWRKIILDGLKGNPLLRQMEFLSAVYHPSQAAFLACMFGYATEGQQTFLLGPRLQEMLAETDADKLPLEFLKLPFNTFYISLVGCEHALWDGTTGRHPVTGVYVHVVDAKRPVILLAMWGAENENSRRVGDDAVQWVTLDLSAAICHTDDDGTQYVNLDDYITRLWADPSNEDSDPGVVKHKEFHRNRDTAIEMARLAFNLVLYVNSERPEKRTLPQRHPGRKKALQQKLAQAQKNPKKRNKAAKLQQEIDAISEARIVWLGESFESQPRDTSGETRDSSASGRVVTRHRRRGHYRSYWTGPRKLADGSRVKGTDKVLRWIPPMWVGSDIGNVLTQRSTTFKFRVERDDLDRPEGSV